MATMSAARLSAQEMRSPFKEAFHPPGQGGLQDFWDGHGDHRLESAFFSLDPVPCGLSSPDQPPSVTTVRGSSPADSPGQEENGHQALPLKASLPSQGSGADPDEGLLLSGLRRLSLGTSGLSEEAPPHTPAWKSGSLFCPPGDRGARPLPPLPTPRDLLRDDMDREVEEFLTMSDTACLLDKGGEKGPVSDTSVQVSRSFRSGGQINYAYVDNPRGKEEEAPSGSPQPAACPPPPPPPQQLHRRLRRSHSGPAGSFHKPVVRATGHFRQASPSSDDDRKPEVPPRAPIPPRAPKPDYRRWSAEVASSAYSDEDRPPKVPPREPLSRGGSRTPSPKSLPSYLYGIMPPTQSFAPDPKYVSSKALQRQHSEGAPHRPPCILPIIENGRKVSSTHYYLLPERPPYLDRYEKFFQEAEEATAGANGHLLWGEEPHEAVAATATLAAPLKRKHLPCSVSP